MLNSETIHPDRQLAELTTDGRTYGSVKSIQDTPNGSAEIHYAQGTVTVAFFGGHLTQITIQPSGEIDPASGTGEVCLPPQVAGLSCERLDNRLLIRGGEQTVEIDLHSSAFRFGQEDGEPFAIQTGIISGGRWRASTYFEKTPASHFYGLGEKAGFLDKVGERYEMWNTDVYSPHVQDIDTLYQSIPFLIHMTGDHCYGLFMDNPGRTFFDMRTQPDLFSFGCETGSLRYYVISGSDMKEIISRYTELTGRMPLPPLWSVGYHQSRYSYMNQEEVLELARTFRNKQIPCDAIYLDIHYMERYRVFTFDRIRFPDPATMIAELKEMGIRLVPIVDPGVKKASGDAIYSEGIQEGYFCRYLEGQLFTGQVWPGESVFPDFSDPQAAEWWGALHRFYTDLGISGIWNDMNEPSVFSSEEKTMDRDVIHHNGGTPKTHGELHNLYGLWMSKATYQGLEQLLGEERPFVLTRAGYAGIQKYAAVWTGDNRSYWEHMALSIPMILNLGLSGVAFAGADVGGFAANAGGELLARWTQAGSLLPFFRNHCEHSSIRQEPWSFGPDVEDICRTYINLRYSLLPTIYSLFREASETGLPVVRPLVLEYPLDPFTTNMNDQFLLGRDILAAPVLQPGVTCRSVYLPEGEWFNYWTGQQHAGNQYILSPAPLVTMPLYIRAGAMIMRSNGAQHSSELATAPRELDIYLPQEGSHSSQHYEDDGLTSTYRAGGYNLILHSLDVGNDEILFTRLINHQGFGEARRPVNIRFKGLSYDRPNLKVTAADGRELDVQAECKYQATAKSFVLTLVLEEWPASIHIHSGREK
ncbi:MAG: alpha-glucosidase [Verrucomicrobia bacterium]|nr:alpha-glucosidase [Deltaproteobacteria bacterium]